VASPGLWYSASPWLAASAITVWRSTDLIEQLVFVVGF
jgi:hypothetical protein